MNRENTDYKDDRSGFKFVDTLLHSSLYNKSDNGGGSVMSSDLYLIARMLIGTIIVFSAFSSAIFIYNIILSSPLNLLILILITSSLIVLHRVYWRVKRK